MHAYNVSLAQQIITQEKHFGSTYQDELKESVTAGIACAEI
jgi:hypothetical protein